MGKAILIYIVIQLLSTAYGVSVIETLKPIVNKKLLDDGYVLKNKYSMYKFNDTLPNILKGFIPFYYAIKAINLIKDGNPVEKAYNKEIEDGNYVTRDELEEEIARRELAKSFGHVKVYQEPITAFEKSEKYVARKNDYNLLETNSDDVKYDISTEKNNDDMSITPFKPNNIVYIQSKEVTNDDVVKAIMDLNSEELDLLDEKIQQLSKIKKNEKKLLLDVA